MQTLQNAHSWIGFQVVTETGVPLGWVRKINVDENANLTSLVLTTFPFLWLPEAVLSSYELLKEEILCKGVDRLIVFENAQERLIQLNVGFVERLGMGIPPWERFDRDEYIIHFYNEDENGTNFSAVPRPRKPSPTPLSSEAEPPL